MQRFFQAPIPGTECVTIGSCALTGQYKCNYCCGPMAQLDRFQLLVQTNEIVGKGSFCTPECVAAWNRYKSRADSDCIDAQHQLLVRRHGRAIYSAPPPRALQSMSRAQWLYACRQMLANEADREIASRELFVERLDYSL